MNTTIVFLLLVGVAAAFARPEADKKASARRFTGGYIGQVGVGSIGHQAGINVGYGSPSGTGNHAYGPYSYGGPNLGSSVYSQSSYGSLPLSSSSYASSGYGTSGYGSPGYGSSGYGSSVYGVPGYGASSYGTSGYGVSSNGASGYGYPNYSSYGSLPALVLGSQSAIGNNGLNGQGINYGNIFPTANGHKPSYGNSQYGSGYYNSNSYNPYANAAYGFGR